MGDQTKEPKSSSPHMTATQTPSSVRAHDRASPPCTYQIRSASLPLGCPGCPGMCRAEISLELPHLASRPRYKKRKTLKFTENKPSLSDARRLASTHRSWGTGAVRDSLICRGKAQ